MRLIDADTLIKDNGLESATKYGNRSEKQRTASYSTMMLYEIAEMIDEAPTIDAEPVKHARWETGTFYRRCTGCGADYDSEKEPPYCEMCGAKMDGGETK